MKKSNIILILLNVFGIFSFVIPNLIPESALNNGFSYDSLLIVEVSLYVAFFIIGIYFKLQEKELSTKEISFIAIFGTFTAVARIPFLGLPNVQPCSYLIICAGIVFGPLMGFIIGGNVAIISNVFLGQGPWTLFQIFGWGLMGLSAGVFHLFSKKKGINYRPKKWILILFGFIWGLLYGWMMNLWFWVQYVSPHTFLSFLTSNINSFYFDLSHGISNAIFLALFSLPTINILTRYRQRFQVTIEEEEQIKPLNRGITQKVEIIEDIEQKTI